MRKEFSSEPSFLSNEAAPASRAPAAKTSKPISKKTGSTSKGRKVFMMVHTEDYADADVLLNPETFFDVKVGDVVEIFHEDQPLVEPLFLPVNKLAPIRGSYAISIRNVIADQFKLQTRKELMVRLISKDRVTLDHVTLTLKDQYVSRADAWRFASTSCDSFVLVQKQIAACGIRSQVKEMLAPDRGPVSCGLVAPHTRVTFRSRSADIVWLVQISKEMWRYTPQGDLFFEKAVNGFCKDLLSRWSALGVSHSLSIIFFSRCFCEPQEGETLPQDHKGRFYRDHYKVVLYKERRLNSDAILQMLKVEFAEYPNLIGWKTPSGDTPISVTPSATSPTSTGPPTPKSTLSSSEDGNFLEALNLVFDMFEKRNLNRDLTKMGLGVVVITGGTGIFNAESELARLTKQRCVDVGSGCDITSMAEPPLHSVPLFRYTNKQPHSLSGDVASSPSHRAKMTNSLYHKPQWIFMAFYSGGESEPGTSTMSLSKFCPISLPMQDSPSTTPFLTPSTSSACLLLDDPNNTSDGCAANASAVTTSTLMLRISSGDTASAASTTGFGGDVMPSTDHQHVHFNQPHHSETSAPQIQPSTLSRQSSASGGSVSPVQPSFSFMVPPLFPSADFALDFAKYDQGLFKLSHKKPPHMTGHSITFNNHSPKLLPSSMPPPTSTSTLSGDILSLGESNTHPFAHSVTPSPSVNGDDNVILSTTPTGGISITKFANPFHSASCRCHDCSAVSSNSRLTANKRRWSTLFPESLLLHGAWAVTGGKYEVFWKSLVEPACLPIFSDFWPSPSLLNKEYTQSIYSIITADSRYQTDPLMCVRELVYQRIIQGFQLVEGDDLRGGKQLSFRLVMGTQFQQITYDPINDPDVIFVKRYIRKRGVKRSRFEYTYDLWNPILGTFQRRTIPLESQAVHEYNWNHLDHMISDDVADMPSFLRYRRALFALVHESFAKCALPQLPTSPASSHLHHAGHHSHHHPHATVPSISIPTSTDAVTESFRKFREMAVSKTMLTADGSPLHILTELDVGPEKKSRQMGGSQGASLPSLKRSSSVSFFKKKSLDALQNDPPAMDKDHSEDSLFEFNERLLEQRISNPFSNKTSAAGSHRLNRSSTASGNLSDLSPEKPKKSKIPTPDSKNKSAINLFSSTKHDQDQDSSFFFEECSTPNQNEPVWGSFGGAHKKLGAGGSGSGRSVNFAKLDMRDKECKDVLCVLEKEGWEKDGRFEWMHMVHDSLFLPSSFFTLELRWLVCSGQTVDSFITSLERRAKQCGFHLVQVPGQQDLDPFKPCAFMWCTGAGNQIIRSMLTSPPFSFVPECRHPNVPNRFLHPTGAAIVDATDHGFTWFTNQFYTAPTGTPSPAISDSLEIARKKLESVCFSFEFCGQIVDELFESAVVTGQI